MELKLFGKSLFEFKSGQARGMEILSSGYNQIKESKYIPDFKKMGSNDGPFELSQFITVSDATTLSSTPSTTTNAISSTMKVVKQATETQRKKLTPKKVYELAMLHDKAFRLNADPEYVDGQIEDFKDKLSMIKAEEYDMRRGTEEIASILMRMENRKKYEEHRAFFDEYPYTTNQRIDSVVKKHDYLKLGEVAQFIADMPKEAVKAMKDYDAECVAMCGKKAVFYIIADKKDFKSTNTRRDPILLAQSPFAHAWQILGAWDDEMLFLEEL